MLFSYSRHERVASCNNRAVKKGSFVPFFTGRGVLILTSFVIKWEVYKIYISGDGQNASFEENLFCWPTAD